MANPTTNFGWQMPQNTDLVKDLPADFEVFGQAVDTDLADLRGGTTGQVLAKASNNDMDFTWATDASGIPATIFDAKGDLIAASAADTAARLAVGTNGQYLSANSGTSTGLEWVNAPSSGANWTLLNSGGTALTGANTITISGISGIETLFIFMEQASAGANSYLSLRINGDTGSNYQYGIGYVEGSSSISATSVNSTGTGAANDSRIYFAVMSTVTASEYTGGLYITGGSKTGYKFVDFSGGVYPDSGNSHRNYFGKGIWLGSAAISSISVISSSGNWDKGKVYVYGA